MRRIGCTPLVFAAAIVCAAMQNPESKIPTPNLDQLARKGMRFTHAQTWHCQKKVQNPSRDCCFAARVITVTIIPCDPTA
jgi:hypothetical protein